MSGYRLANGMNNAVYNPKMPDHEVKALESVFDYQDGTSILHRTIKYQN